MITIQSGKMIIPENERFVGFAGDNLTCTKEFLVPDAADSDSAYILYLRFDDDRVSSAVLEKSIDGDDLVLTWTVSAEHLLKSGVILAQIKITDGDVTVAHTGCDYFIAAPSAELADDGGELDTICRSEFERRLKETVAEVEEDFPTALSELKNDVGYIPVFPAESAPPSSYTTEVYEVPCMWVCDERAWFVYGRSEITIPGSTSQYVYSFIELAAHQDISGKEDTSNKVTSISASSTNMQYPSALAVKNYVDTVIGGIENGSY